MFTGIIERTASVKRVEMRGRAKAVTLSKPASWKLKKGQSVNVSGICSTVVSSSATSFTVEYMPETLRVTTAASFIKGTNVNLERSLKYGDRMDGHLVSGHIEGVGKVGKVEKEGRSLLLSIKVPALLGRYALERGSITIEGVSLTVARRHGPWVTVALVPHTLSHTRLGQLSVDDSVNIETDIRHRALIKPRARVTSYATKPLRKGR